MKIKNTIAAQNTSISKLKKFKMDLVEVISVTNLFCMMFQLLRQQLFLYKTFFVLNFEFYCARFTLKI